jgi:transcriptional regulator with XRE-family HTH domain
MSADDGQLRTFGQRLRHVRQQRGLKQAELAVLVDLPQSSISSYEADARSPTLQTVQALAVALGCSVAMLIGEAGDDELPAGTALPDRLLELNAFISQLPPVDQDELLTALRVLVSLRLDSVHRRRHTRHKEETTAY